MSAAIAAWSTTANEPVVIMCAWCHDVKLGGQYVGIGLCFNTHAITIDGVHHLVSHGICPTCQARLEAEIHDVRGRHS